LSVCLSALPVLKRASPLSEVRTGSEKSQLACRRKAEKNPDPTIRAKCNAVLLQNSKILN
jgi:hypothetical protein